MGFQGEAMNSTNAPRHRTLARAAIVCVGTLLLATLPARGFADSESPAPAEEQINAGTLLAAKTYPGVQLIQTTYTARITVRQPLVDQAAVQALFVRILAQVASGAIEGTEAGATEALIDALVESPDTYLYPGRKRFSEPGRLSAVGTGWVISPDGYMITAAHVVEADRVELRQQFATQSLTKLSKEAVDELTAGDNNFTPDQVQRLTDMILGWAARNLTVSRLRIGVDALVTTGVDGQGKKQRPVPAEVVDVGEPYPGNDVALLKIDGVDNLPTLPLGTDDDVAPGSTLYVVGYPAASTFNSGFSEDAQAQPTVTQGPVTAIKSTETGMPVFQTQAPASPGNSGGPVLADDAKVVGVLVAAAVGDDGVALEGQEFVIPVSVVTEMLEANDVTPETGENTTAYSTAVDEFYRDHFKAALPLFQKSQQLYPGHPYVGEFIDDSNAGIAGGKDKTPAPAAADDGIGLPGWVILLLAVALVVILVLVLVLVLVVRRASPRPAAAPASWAPQPQLPAAPGYPQQQQQGYAPPPPDGQPLPAPPPQSPPEPQPPGYSGPPPG